MGTYYYITGTYQASWSTANTTTTFNDNSAGDSTTGVSGTGSPPTITAFFDNGSSQTLGSWQFTEQYQSVAGVAWILEGSTNSTSWTTINSGTVAYAGGSPVTTNQTGSGTYRYFRLSLSQTGYSGGAPISLTDWRMTLFTVTHAKGAEFFCFF